MFQRKTALFSAFVLGVAILGATASPASAKPATRKVGNPATCKGATYPTINAAVAAANPGDTIKVCPGTYTENVAVNKPLKFLGAKAGKDGRNRKASAKESVVKNSSGAGFTLTGAANNVTIDGFTIPASTRVRQTMELTPSKAPAAWSSSTTSSRVTATE
jgi:pectin methylesterase-like acyl-CoA thioesterase